MSMRLVKRGDLTNVLGYQRQVNNVFSHNFAIIEFESEKEAQEFVDSHAFLAFPNRHTISLYRCDTIEHLFDNEYKPR